MAPNVVNPDIEAGVLEEDEEEEEQSEDDDDDDAGVGVATNAKKQPKSPRTPKSPNSSVASDASDDREKVVSPRAIELAELFAQLVIEKGYEQKINKDAIKHAYTLIVKKVCACGVQLKGKYVDLGGCSKCTSGKKTLHCVSCAKRLMGAYKVEGGICAACVKTEERKQKLAEKQKFAEMQAAAAKKK